MELQSSRFGKTIRWFYHESGIASLYGAGRDAWFVILARSCRMFAFGAASLVMALFFAELEFSDFRIGLFMTLTLVGDLILSFFLTLMADGLGRRRILFGGGLLMALSGAVFSFFENFWILLVAAVVGVISATGSDFGPFRAIEESTLSGLTTQKTRSDVLTWYVTCSSLGSAIGVEVSGRVVEALRSRDKWSLLRTYHAVFWIYIIMGVVNMVLASSMSVQCEAEKKTAPAAEEEVSDESAVGLLDESPQDDEEEDGSQDARPNSAPPPPPPPPPATAQKTSRFSQISSATRSVMYKLWFLLLVDSLADGMVSYTLTNYFLDRKFSMSKSRLGDIMSTAYLFGTLGTPFAGPLARHLGLVNTMVFTHLPSSAAVLLFPFPSGIVLTIILLFVRTGLNNMDQAPRTSFIAAVVASDERTAVMGITAMLRTLASAVGPTFTGALAGSDRFWIAFVVAGSLRICYDLGLWAMFVNMRLDLHENAGQKTNDPRRSADEEETMEMQPVERAPEH